MPAASDVRAQHGKLVESARAHREAMRLGEAEALLAFVLAADPRNGEALHQLGLTFVAAGRLAEAVVPLGQASAHAPTDPDRHIDLAEVYRALGDRSAAQRCLRLATLLGPDREDLLFQLGRACSSWSELAEAERWLRRAMALRRPYAEAHVVLGLVCYKAGRLDDAIRAYADAARETPSNARAYEMLAGTLTEIGAPLHEVMKPAKLFAELEPGRPEAVIPVAQYLRDTGDDAGSRRLLTGLINRQMEAAARDEMGCYGFRIVDPDFLVSRIGEFAFQLDLLAKMKLLGWIPPFVMLLAPPPETVVNRSLLDYWRPYFSVVDDPREVARLAPLRQRIGFNPVYVRMPDGIAVSKNRAYHAVQEEWQRQGRKPLLRLTPAHAALGREGLRRLGVPDEAWFVCLHVREGGYLKEASNSQESARNADIMTYLPAIEEIVRRGGWVIRIGDPSVTPLPQMDHVVDYALTSVRSGEMDVFLVARAKFLLGTSSGMFAVAMAFGTPSACANFFPPGERLYTSNDVFVPKLIRDRLTGRLLSFEECLTMPLALTYDSRRVNEMGLDVVDSEPEDIRLLAGEMLRRLDDGMVYTAYDDALQQRWKALSASYSTGDAGSRVARHWLIRHRHLFSRAEERR